jgi:hypothetical protein
MNNPVLIGSSIPPGADQVRLHDELKQGDIVLTILPEDFDDAIAMARECRQRGIYLCFSELLHRGSEDIGKGWRKIVARNDFFTREQMDAIVDAAGKYYFARMSIGEAGGVLYWPKAYTINRRVKNWENLPACQTHEQAEKAYVEYCKHWLDHERREFGKGPLMNVDSSMVFKYHCMAGLDVLCLESMPGDPHLMHAAIRGAARAYHKPWGSHIAMQCYGGMCFDDLYQKRWRSSLLYSYITGAQFIYPESGHYKYFNLARKQEFGFHSKQTKRIRRDIRDAWQLARIHRRPNHEPITTLGLLHGKHDGAPGLWNRYTWGQYHDDAKWLEGPAERGWELVDRLHRKEDWPKETIQGEVDYSGNPPYGQYDAVPIEASLDDLKRYTCLVCLGWNTMTREDYDKLTAYVEQGGRLLMFLPQLSTRTDRDATMKLINNGDLSKLFGVQVKGAFDTDVRGIKCMRDASIKSWRMPLWRISTDPRFMGNFTPAKVKLAGAQVISGWSDYYPVEPADLESKPMLVEHKIGKGFAYLVTAWEYPADEGLKRFTHDLLRVVVQGEQGHIRLLGPDRVRYAVYEGKLPGSRRKVESIYLLNTDPDCDALCRLNVRGRDSGTFTIPANDLRLAYCRGDVLLIPRDKCVDIESWLDANSVKLFTATAQTIEVHNVGRQATSVSINGTSRTIEPGASAMIKTRKRVDPDRAAFFADDFLDEPKVRYRDAPLPY